MNRLLYLENCVSTQDEIINLINEDETTAVFTFNQTKGRGQYGNKWEVIPNENLAYSIAVIRNKISISGVCLNYYTAIIVRDFLDNMTNVSACIKWPNDIILNGKKVCGMLIEKTKKNGNDYFIIGIGINILQKDFSNLPKAGSILSVTGVNIDLITFIQDFHTYFISRIMNIPDEEKILEEYNLHLFKRDTISVFQKNKVRQNGIVKNADNAGYLWIDLENEALQKFFHKEIEMLY